MTLHIHLKFPDGDPRKPLPKPPQCQNDPCVWHPKNEPLIDSDEMGGIPVPAPPPPATDPHEGASETRKLRPAPTREEFAQLVGTYEAQAYDHGYCEGCASYDDEGLSGAKRTAGRAESRVKATGAALLAAFDALAAERDEWKKFAKDAQEELVKMRAHVVEAVAKKPSPDAVKLVVDAPPKSVVRPETLR